MMWFTPSFFFVVPHTSLQSWIVSGCEGNSSWMCQAGSEGLMLLYRYRTVCGVSIGCSCPLAPLLAACYSTFPVPTVGTREELCAGSAHTSSSMDALKSAGRAIIKSPGVPRHTWGTSKHESEYPAFICLHSLHQCCRTANYLNICPFTLKNAFGYCMTVHIAFICLCIVWDIHLCAAYCTKYSIIAYC